MFIKLLGLILSSESSSAAERAQIRSARIFSKELRCNMVFD
ncbi:unnamed protein product [Larinioides sclopetarius]|uniref:Uncharacterized protein n=1 Tax=Larinioides sclopetarius TaxID=280406 RepID=A0AAV1ZBX5_9ARAC